MSVVALEERGLTPATAGPRDGGQRRRRRDGARDPGRARLRGLGRDRQARRGGAADALGAAGILTRDEVTAEGKPLESERWAGAVDAVGGATLPYVLRTLRIGAVAASSGNAGGPALATTVFPFILRGVALLGMDSVNVPIDRRRELWDRLATDLRPRDLGVHCRRSRSRRSTPRSMRSSPARRAGAGSSGSAANPSSELASTSPDASCPVR